MIYLAIIYVAFFIWFIYALRNAPQMDDNGNFITKTKNNGRTKKTKRTA